MNKPPIDMPLFEHEGYTGAFTRRHAVGALPNGSRIQKAEYEPGDSQKVGALGTVLGSFSHKDLEKGAILYFVEWDAMPRVAVAVLERKIALAPEHMQ